MADKDIFDDVEGDDTPAAPSPEPTRETAKAEDQDVPEGRVTLKCPHSMHSLSHPDGAFPTVTQAGTEMSASEAKLAKAAAKAARKKLITVGGRNN